jgi:hypothetical protein
MAMAAWIWKKCISSRNYVQNEDVKRTPQRARPGPGDHHLSGIYN